MPRADVVVLVARGVEESVGGVESRRTAYTEWREKSVGGQSVKEESSANSTEVHYDESSVPRQEVPAPRFAVSKPSSKPSSTSQAQRQRREAMERAWQASRVSQWSTSSCSDSPSASFHTVRLERRAPARHVTRHGGCSCVIC